jgi:hypothetical protein
MMSTFLAPESEADLALLDDMPNWAVPDYSRNQVDKAGFALIAPEVDLLDLAWAYTVIDNWRAAHSYPLLNFRINLRQKLKSICKNAVVAQRIKTHGIHSSEACSRAHAADANAGHWGMSSGS